ncbi:MAG TPA: zf-HC2 domain-containing protein [Terracidiphilus sp.]
MDHEAAVQQMVAERYLLDELAPELRDEFEEHMFDCAECSLDLRAGAYFVEEVKLQLPDLTRSFKGSRAVAPARPAQKSRDWFSWIRPAFAVPAFAALLAVIGYQNLATIPSLRSEATQPRLVPWASFHTGTRGDAHLTVPADRKQGAGVLIELSQENTYTSYAFELYDPQGRLFWSHSAAASDQAGPGQGMFSLVIPGEGLQQGSYTLVTSGITPQGGRAEIDRRILDVHFDD